MTMKSVSPWALGLRLALGAVCLCGSGWASAQGLAGPLFQGERTVVGSAPTAVALSDVDGDGDLDVVTGDTLSGGVSLLANRGAGGLGGHVFHGFGDNINDVAFGDMDGDGDEDIVAVDAGRDRISILLNDGAGGYGEPVWFETGDGPDQLALADVNGDGALDAAVSYSSGDGASVLYNTGAAAFFARFDYPEGERLSSIALADVNGDGSPDLIAADYETGEVLVRLNFGTGVFGAATRIEVYPELVAMTLSDLDGDGALDLACASMADRLLVLLGGGDGTFGVPIWQRAGELRGIAAGDLDGDGLGDLVVTVADTPSVDVFLGIGGGVFGSAVSIPTSVNPDDVVLGDMDADGDLDIVACNLGPSLGSVGQDEFDDVILLLNSGDGSFPGTGRAGTIEDTVDVSLADLDGDGDLDAVTTTVFGRKIVEVLHNTRRGAFRIAQEISLDGPGRIGLADLDLDGDADLLVCVPGFGVPNTYVSVLLNDGAGFFGPETRVGVGDGPSDVAIGDLDGDGWPDAVVANYQSDDLSVLLSSALGDGLFEAEVRLPLGDGPVGLRLGDLDGDGDLDLAVASERSDEMHVLLNDGAGGFGPGVVHASGAGPSDVAMGDIDADGDLDLVVTHSVRWDAGVWFNDGSGGFGSETRYLTGGKATGVELADLDLDGDLDIAISSQQRFCVNTLRNRGDGTFDQQRRITTGPYPRGLAAADLDGDLDPDILVADQAVGVTVLMNRTRSRCNQTDLAEPLGVLDSSDVAEFVRLATGGDEGADLAAPIGVVDLRDVVAFIDAFVSGCP